MFVEMLASEPQMVVHVAVSAIEARVFGSSSMDVKDVLYPVHILLWSALD